MLRPGVQNINPKIFVVLRFQRYQEASQHILDALALQETDAVGDPNSTEDKRGVTSAALWDSLKTCCLHLRRLDLATICDRRELDSEFVFCHAQSENSPELKTSALDYSQHSN